MFSEQNVGVTIYFYYISSMLFSKFTEFFSNCLIELSLILTKSRTKLQVIFSEIYCVTHLIITRALVRKYNYENLRVCIAVRK